MGSVLEPRDEVRELAELPHEGQPDRHLAERVRRLFPHHLRALDGDALLRRERVRPLLKRGRAERSAAAGEEARLRLREALAQLLTLGAQRVERADEARRPLELLLALADLLRHPLPVGDDRVDDAHVDE